jgi:hypothetical protein
LRGIIQRAMSCGEAGEAALRALGVVDPLYPTLVGFLPPSHPPILTSCSHPSPRSLSTGSFAQHGWCESGWDGPHTCCVRSPALAGQRGRRRRREMASLGVRNRLDSSHPPHIPHPAHSPLALFPNTVGVNPLGWSSHMLCAQINDGGGSESVDTSSQDSTTVGVLPELGESWQCFMNPVCSPMKKDTKCPHCDDDLGDANPDTLKVHVFKECIKTRVIDPSLPGADGVTTAAFGVFVVFE